MPPKAGSRSGTIRRNLEFRDRSNLPGIAMPRHDELIEMLACEGEALAALARLMREIDDVLDDKVAMSPAFVQAEDLMRARGLDWRAGQPRRETR